MVKGLSIPKVFTIHGFIFADTACSNQCFPKIRSALWHAAETAGWADQRDIISISPYVRNRLEKSFHGKIHDIENPIGEEFFEIERREEVGRIFSSAAISPRKNTLALIDALKIMIDDGIQARLWLAGKITDPDYETNVRSKIIANNLSGNVSLLGSIPRSRVAEELSKASLFALVSLEENAPLAIEEAMAAGVPVVASNRCGMPYMVAHGKTGFLVDPCDPQDIADAMKKILSQDGLRKKMVEASRALARERFHPRKVSMRTHEVYREVLAKQSPKQNAFPDFRNP
jgi:glycosyltransferase involved in cell wall biosynthesis